MEVMPRQDLREAAEGARATASVPGTDTSDENVAKLAYALWQYRGCPIGSPEVDWTEAERQLHRAAPLRTGASR